MDENKESTVAENAGEESQPTAAENATTTTNEAGEAVDTHKTLTQDEVNSIVRERLDRQQKSFYERIGVADDKALEELLNRARGYDDLTKENESLRAQVGQSTEELAFLRNGILEDRYDDVRTWFRGKGEAITQSSLHDVLEKHPEWISKPIEKTVSVEPLGATRGEKPKETEDDIAQRYFGLKSFVK